MKIDFNGQEMIVKFDKAPNLLYFNEEGKGCGKVFLNGVQRKGLQKVKIEAETAGPKGWPPLKYRIQYFEPGKKESQYISNMAEELCIGIKILDIDEFSDMLEWIKQVISDERISDSIREEYINSLKEFSQRFERG